jgi:hypothetical protein
MREKHSTKGRDSEVLFQKLGEVWYAFSEIDGEVIYSPLPEGVDPHSTKLELFEVVEEHLEKVAQIYKKGPEIPA